MAACKVKRERPPMPPLAVRVQVAERQFDALIPKGREVYDLLVPDWSLARRLKFLLFHLFRLYYGPNLEKVRVEPHALDHDPALILRPYNPRIEDVAARYTPHAHDPQALIYREKANHDQKTFGRKAGAERTVTTKGSDIWLKSKFDRLEGRTKQRPKAKIQSRGFSKAKRPFSRKPRVDIPSR